MLNQVYSMLLASFDQMVEAGGRVCASVRQKLATFNKTGWKECKGCLLTARLPMSVQMRGHRKAMADVLLLTMMSLPVYALTPPGTVISNTASASFTISTFNASITSNTVDVTSTIISTPSFITLYQYAPSGTGALSVDVTTSHATAGPPGSGFIVSSNPTVPVPGSTPLVLNPASIALNPVEQFHTGEPIFVNVDDQDQNLDPSVRETIKVVVSSSTTGDVEELILTETGPDTGVFMGYVQSTFSSVNQYDGALTLGQETDVRVSYVDKYDGTDSSAESVLIDPFGRLFNSVDGSTLDGVTIMILDSAGNPANVYGDDGLSTYPNVLVTGGSATDSSGNVYDFPPGGYRFPLLAPGVYQMVIVPPNANVVFPSTRTIADLQTIPGAPYALDPQASFGQFFTLVAGPPLHADIPFDQLAAVLVLDKNASTAGAAVGDFVQYSLNIENQSQDGTGINTVITDVLPEGFRYQSGSIRATGSITAITEPVLSPDRRTMTITVGDLVAGGRVDISYVTEVSSSTPMGKAVNIADAVDADGSASNTAQAAVRITEDLFYSKSFIAGRVIKGECGMDVSELPGLENVRIYMENGTYNVTDENGMYHFEGVEPGTHVVQVDRASVPENLELIDCEQNSRFAGEASSQFVDIQGGSLWRADFYVREKSPIKDSSTIYLESELIEDEIRYTIELENGKVPVENYRLIVSLPEGVSYRPNSSLIDGAAVEDPSVTDNVLVYRLGDLGDNWSRTIELAANLQYRADGELVTKALMLVDTDLKRNLRSEPVSNTIDVQRERRESREFVFQAFFEPLGVALTEDSKTVLRNTIKNLGDVDVKLNHIIGHTDNRPIRDRSKKLFRNNTELSMARADVVRNFMEEELGVSSEDIVVEGKAYNIPVGSNDTNKGRALNRRAELHVQTSEIVGKGKAEVSVPRSETNEILLVGQPVYDLGDDYNRAPEQKELRIEMFDEFWIEKADPGIEWLMPQADYYSPLASVNIAVKHAPDDVYELRHNGTAVDALLYFGKIKNRAGTVARSYWQGVPLSKGMNRFEFIVKDKTGALISRIENNILFAGAPVQVELAEEYSRLIADGARSPIIAVRLYDEQGNYARPGMRGVFQVSDPYMSKQQRDSLEDIRLTGIDRHDSEFTVGAEGIALIELEPTTQTGKVDIDIILGAGQIKENVEAWLKPELREWLLVGLADGVIGSNSLEGNMQALDANDYVDHFYSDGRLAFFTKGQIKGDWLLTAAYDSEKGDRQEDHRINQLIQPGTYYTIYGDGSRQQHEASTSKKMYIKVERDQFYALYGDFVTDLNDTELSKYTRTYTGFKSEMETDAFKFKVFAAENIHNYVKDEIRGDGTSGLYRLSSNDLVINSEKIRIETRDRFRSEVILDSKELKRHVDYNIDYVDGTIYFRQPIASNDTGFNPLYIIAEYEVDADVVGDISAGGRGVLKMQDGKIEIGATVVHDADALNPSDLVGADASYQLDEETRIRAELSGTSTEASTGDVEGTAYLVEAEHRGDKLDAKAYVREQEDGFGLGQLSDNLTATRKIGIEGRYRTSERVTVDAQVRHEEVLDTDAKRDVVDTSASYQGDGYSVDAGVRITRDEDTNGQSRDSDLLLVGAKKSLMQGDLDVRANAEIGVGSTNDNPDYPSRYIIGADYFLTGDVTLYAENEITQGDLQDTQMSRVGLRSTPWQGGRVDTTFNRQVQENGIRTFSNLGLTQSLTLTERWTMDAALDQVNTIRRPGSTPFNSNVPIAQGSTDDFTALSLGATYQGETFTLVNRVEARHAETEDKIGLIVNWERKLIDGIGYSVSSNLFDTDRTDGSSLLDGKLSFSIGFRPVTSDWITLSKFEYKIDEAISAAQERTRTRKLINNTVANYKPNLDDQLSINYGIKYVLNNFSGSEYSGVTQLLGTEYRHDIGEHFDLGVHARTLYSVNSSNYLYSIGASFGWNLARNMWLSLGYNVVGFEDEDFSAAGYTAKGPYLRFRMKFDSSSAREMRDWMQR